MLPESRICSSWGQQWRDRNLAAKVWSAFDTARRPCFHRLYLLRAGVSAASASSAHSPANSAASGRAPVTPAASCAATQAVGIALREMLTALFGEQRLESQDARNLSNESVQHTSACMMPTWPLTKCGDACCACAISQTFQLQLQLQLGSTSTSTWFECVSCNAGPTLHLTSSAVDAMFPRAFERIGVGFYRSKITSWMAAQEEDYRCRFLLLLPRPSLLSRRRWVPPCLRVAAVWLGFVAAWTLRAF